MINFKTILTAILLLCCTTISAYDFEYEGIYYTVINSTEVEVTSGANNTGNVIIPSTVQGYTVTSIGSSAFSYCTGLTSIEIPASVTSIGSGAFSGCSGIKYIISKISADRLFVPDGGAFDGIEKENCTLFVPASARATYTATDAWNEFATIIELDKSKKCGDNLYWVLNNRTLYIIGYGEMVYPSYISPWNDQRISINSVKFLGNATSIRDSAFRGCVYLTNVELSKGLTSIEAGAFYNCNSLTNIELPEGVTSIGGLTFYGCSALTSIEIPEGVTSIGRETFYNCRSLTNIELPEGVTSIGSSAFSGCGALTSIEIPEGVTSISSYTFDGCSALTSIEIPEGVTSIGSCAFRGCSALTSIEIPEGVTSIGNYAFYNCRSLTSIEIPEGVTSIGNYAFYNCRSLTSIEIPEGVTSIAEYAFYNCSALTSIELPEGVTSIGSSAFYDCRSLTSIFSNIPAEKLFTPGSNAFYNVDKNNCTLYVPVGAKATYATTTQWKDFSNIVEFDNTKKCGDNLYWLYDETTAALTIVGSGAMYNYDNTPAPWNAFKEQIMNVEIKAGITSIGRGAFSGCSGIKYIISNIAANGLFVPDAGAFDGIDKENCALIVPYSARATYIATDGWNEFAAIIGLISNYKCGDNLYWALNSEDSTLYIFGYGTMNNYSSSSPWYSSRSSIKSVKIFGNATSIGERVFYGCSALTRIEIPASVTSIGNYAFYNCSALTSIEIPEGVTSIGSSAFSGCSALTSTELPKALTSIGNYAFDNCSAITSIEIPASVTSIGSSAFYNCSKLTSIELPEGVTSIGSSAFSGCSAITSIEIPASVTSIGSSAFYNCSAIELFLVDANNKVYDSRDNCNAIIETATNTLMYGCKNTKIPASVTSIGNYAFSGCSALTSIEIPEGVTSIGNNAFYNCSALTSIELPEGVTSIGSSAFYNCHSLTNIEIPASVTSIGNFAFYNCSALTSIFSYIPADKLFTPGSNAFDFVDKNKCTLYVPKGAKATYAATEQWKSFRNIVEFVNEITLKDSEPYTATKAKKYNKITYNRTFNNTNWQAWYMPFAVDYDKLAANFEVAEINDMHQKDTDHDGVMDETELEVLRVLSGTLMANYPYLVRAKTTGEKSIVLENVTLEAAKSTTIDCSSILITYYFVGTFTGVSGAEMYENGYYALSGGAMMMAADNTVSLKPYRWYMKSEAREDVEPARVIRIKFADETTGIEERANDEPAEAVYYDLSGRRVENPTKGIYILNGKKVLIK